MDEELFFMDEPKKWFLEIGSLCKDAVEDTEITTKDLEYYRSLVNKIASGFERIDSSFERSLGTSLVVLSG